MTPKYFQGARCQVLKQSLNNRNWEGSLYSKAGRITEKKTAENKGFTRLVFLLATTLIGLVAFYLYQVNSVTVDGYRVQELEKQIEQIKDENEKMMIEAAQLKSMYQIEQVVKDSNLVDSKEVSYIEIGTETVAMR